jgi:hypothetical protein
MQSHGGIMVPLTTRALDSKTLTKGSEVVTDALQLSALTTYPPVFLRTYPPRRLPWRDGLNVAQAS